MPPLQMQMALIGQRTDQNNAKELEMEPEYNLKSSCPASVSSKIGIKTEFLDANVWVKI